MSMAMAGGGRGINHQEGNRGSLIAFAADCFLYVSLVRLLSLGSRGTPVGAVDETKVYSPLLFRKIVISGKVAAELKV